MTHEKQRRMSVAEDAVRARFEEGSLRDVTVLVEPGAEVSAPLSFADIAIPAERSYGTMTARVTCVCLACQSAASNASLMRSSGYRWERIFSNGRRA